MTELKEQILIYVFALFLLSAVCKSFLLICSLLFSGYKIFCFGCFMKLGKKVRELKVKHLTLSHKLLLFQSNCFCHIRSQLLHEVKVHRLDVLDLMFVPVQKELLSRWLWGIPALGQDSSPRLRGVHHHRPSHHCHQLHRSLHHGQADIKTPTECLFAEHICLCAADGILKVISWSSHLVTDVLWCLPASTHYFCGCFLH